MSKLNKQQKRLITVITTFLIIVIEFAIYFNAVLLPNIKYDFGITEYTAQYLISTMLVTLGFSGFIYGGITNTIGRKPILVFAVSVFSHTTVIGY